MSDDGAGLIRARVLEGWASGIWPRGLKSARRSRSQQPGPTSISFSVPHSQASAWSRTASAVVTAFLAVVGITWHKFDPISLVVAGITAVMAARTPAFVRILRRRTAK